ncbi:MAG: hypothetical protein O7F73_15950 [Gammaproteobacteria bacterium]|nr:hypothetical protein [Gammaproteobacteria bacterium]
MSTGWDHRVDVLIVGSGAGAMTAPTLPPARVLGCIAGTGAANS